MYEALIARIRYHIQKANFMGLKEAESTLLLAEAADAIEELSKIREEQKAQIILMATEDKPRWISAEEMLPKDLQNVLVIDDGHVTIGHCEHYYCDEQICVEWHDTLYYPIDPPYWMPLPKPPKESNQ